MATIKVTQDQVDNARLLMALDRADGRQSEEWIIRLASARSAPPELTDQQHESSSPDDRLRPAAD